MNLGDVSWRMVAIVVSLSLHLLAVVAWSKQTLLTAAENDMDQQPLFVQLSFPQPPVKIPAPVEPPPPVVKKQPKPLPKPKPKPVAKPLIKPPVEKPKRKVEEVAATVLPAPPVKTSSRQIREAYLAELLAKIEKNKFYPTIARRRSLQGEILVRFKLTCEGSVEELNISGKHNLLRKAANQAVEASLPLPNIPPEVDCPLPVNYAMAYTLEK